MNYERLKELRMKVDMDMHLHNLEDIRAMEGCFGQESGHKIVNNYIEKFSELIVRECVEIVLDSSVEYATRPQIAEELKEHFGVE